MKHTHALAFAAILASALAFAGAASGAWHRVVIQIDAGEIPFLLNLPAAPAPPRPDPRAKEITMNAARPPVAAIIRNGAEDIELAAVWQASPAVCDGMHFSIDFPHYDSALKGGVDLVGDLGGIWTKASAAGETSLNFVAKRIPDGAAIHRFLPGAAPGVVDYADGPPQLRYRMNFDKSGPAIATLAFTGEIAAGASGEIIEVIHATVETPTGDYRFLSGAHWRRGALNDAGDNFALSVFDGAHAFLFKGTIDNDRASITGSFHSGNHWSDTFTATRLAEGEDFALPDPFSEVTLKAGETRLRLAALESPKYAGKAVIVQIFGTWCPNCHDEAPLLRELYEKHHVHGLEILGLAYEHGDDTERARRQIKRFKERHDIRWDILPAGKSNKSLAAATLPQLSAIKAFPTTIFINRDGTVRAIHSGFAGPATGAEHEKTRADFERLVDECLAH